MSALPPIADTRHLRSGNVRRHRFAGHRNELSEYAAMNAMLVFKAANDIEPILGVARQIIV
jgi:hypothetical protein